MDSALQQLWALIVKVTLSVLHRLEIHLLMSYRGKMRCGRLLKTTKFLAIWVVHASVLIVTTAAPP
eukprot:COSAG02_NODE_7228_length_3108_cov_3.111665_2_plen_66_part_00